MICFLKKIKATVAAKNSGITIKIENSGIRGVAVGVGVNVGGVVLVGAGIVVAGVVVGGVDGDGVDGFAVGLADGVGVGVGLVDVEIRFW